MKNAAAFALAAVSAYSVSFAADMFVGWAVKIYPVGVFKAIPTWIIISAVTGIAAVRIARRAYFVVIPYAVLALLAAFGGIVGHRYYLAVAGIMFLMTISVWGVMRPPPPSIEDVWSVIESIKSTPNKGDPR